MDHRIILTSSLLLIFVTFYCFDNYMKTAKDNYDELLFNKEICTITDISFDDVLVKYRFQYKDSKFIALDYKFEYGHIIHDLMPCYITPKSFYIIHQNQKHRISDHTNLCKISDVYLTTILSKITINFEDKTKEIGHQFDIDYPIEKDGQEYHLEYIDHDIYDEFRDYDCWYYNGVIKTKRPNDYTTHRDAYYYILKILTVDVIYVTCIFIVWISRLNKEDLYVFKKYL